MSIRQLLQAYQAVPASVLGGNINAYIKNDHAADYPGGSDTGIGWTYLRYPHASRSDTPLRPRLGFLRSRLSPGRASLALLTAPSALRPPPLP